MRAVRLVLNGHEEGCDLLVSSDVAYMMVVSGADWDVARGTRSDLGRPRTS